MLNPKEELEHLDVKKVCRELGTMPPPDIFINLKIHDKNDNLIFDDTQRGHSWTRNFWNIIFKRTLNSTYQSSNLWGAGHLTIRNLDGSYTTTDSGFYTSGNLGSDASIRVGSADTPFDINQYNLTSTISHGTGSGQLMYQASVEIYPKYNTITKVWTREVSRIFLNTSGNTIIVRECGLYNSTATVSQYFERTVLDPVAELVDSARLTITYLISMDFSPIDYILAEEIYFDSNSSALLHFNGDHESTVFTDESGKTWTPFVNAHLSNEHVKYGSTSGAFLSGNSYISTPPHEDFEFGTGPFTVDFWVRFTQLGMHQTIISIGANSFRIRLESDVEHLVFNFGSTAGYVYYDSWRFFQVNTWYHIAVTRDEFNIVRVFRDGQFYGVGETRTQSVGPGETRVGLTSTNTEPFRGYIDELHISKICRWDDHFTVIDREY